MDNTDKLRLLKDAYEAAKEAGAVGSQKEFAALVGVNKSTMSSAMNGVESALTDRLLSKVARAVKAYKCPPELVEQTANTIRTIAGSDELRDLIEEQRRTINEMAMALRKQAEVIAQLLEGRR